MFDSFGCGAYNPGLATPRGFDPERRVCLWKGTLLFDIVDREKGYAGGGLWLVWKGLTYKGAYCLRIQSEFYFWRDLEIGLVCAMSVGS
ncbi:hypothetical protein JCM17960_08740 [Magnetospira thiophila]